MGQEQEPGMRARDGRALAEFVIREHHSFVLAVARRFAGADHADDVASRVYEKLLHGRLPDPDRPLRPWLRRVVRNQAIDHVRSLRAHEPLDPERAHHTVIDLADGVVDRIVVEHALSSLSDVERAAVVADLVGLTPQEVGSQHGRSAHAVHSLAWRARRQLRALLEPAILPLGAGLAWLRRVLHRADHPSVPYAAEVLIVAAFAFGVGSHATAPGLTQPPRLATSAPAPSVPASKPVRAAAAAPIIAQPARGESPVTVEPPSEPGDARVEIEQRPGAAAPRRVVVVQPEFDTPLGRTGGDTEFECTYETDRIPRTPMIYQTC